MKLPRDVNAAKLIKSLKKLGYEVSRQTGSHIRLTCSQGQQHHLTIPNHNPLKIGTLSAIISDLAEYHKKSKRACKKNCVTV